MFLMLGLLVFPSRLGDVAVEGTAIALVLVLVARPVATVIALLPFGFNAREQAAIAWAGLRGAVPVVLATFPIIEGVTGSLEVFDVVFFAVVVSTLLRARPSSACGPPARDERPARAAAAAHRERNDPRPRRAGARYPVAPGDASSAPARKSSGSQARRSSA